jgi:hypothetical protein
MLDHCEARSAERTSKHVEALRHTGLFFAVIDRQRATMPRATSDASHESTSARYASRRAGVSLGPRFQHEHVPTGPLSPSMRQRSTGRVLRVRVDVVVDGYVASMALLS